MPPPAPETDASATTDGAPASGGAAFSGDGAPADPLAACRYELPLGAAEAWVVDHYPCGKIVGRFEIPAVCQTAPTCGCILGNVTAAAFTQAGTCRCHDVDGSIVFESGCP